MTSTSSKFFKLDFKPGFHRETTQYAEAGSWFDGDRVRFRRGKPENLRGYQKQHSTAFSGVGRDLLTWANDNTQKLLSVGTEKRLFLLSGDVNFDITPIDSIVSIGSLGTKGSFATATGSKLIEVSLNNTGTSVGDGIQFSNCSLNGFTQGTNFAATSFGGPVYVVASTSGLNHFYVSTLHTAVSTVTGGKGVASFLIPSGQSNNIQGLGYGAGVYNAGTSLASAAGGRGWSRPALSSNITFLATQWSLDTWGEDLLAVRRGSQLFHWDADASITPERAVIVSTSPSTINSIVVSPNDRHAIALGTNEFGNGDFNPLLIRWSDQEDFTNWTPSVSSTSGELQLIEGTRIEGAIRGRNAIHVFTDNGMYALQFVGPPFIFSLTLLGSNCGAIGPHAAVAVDGASFWMGENNFYAFDGRVRKLDCTVRRFVYDNINLVNKDKIFAAINSEFHEIVWLYPSGESSEPNAYVAYNYMEDVWTYGTGFYTTFADSNVFQSTVATGELAGTGAGGNPAVSIPTSTGQFIWANEPTSVFTGDTSIALTSFLESSDFDIADGTDMMFVNRLIPDYTFNDTGVLQFKMNTQEYPAATTIGIGPFTINRSTKKVDFRARGRQGNVRVSTGLLGTSWRWGSVRLAAQPDGKR